MYNSMKQFKINFSKLSHSLTKIHVDFQFHCKIEFNLSLIKNIPKLSLELESKKINIAS